MEQGSVLRLSDLYVTNWHKDVSIPLEQGSVLRRMNLRKLQVISQSLNPFGTGQCLTTLAKIASKLGEGVSIPLEQGSVLRLQAS